jgi:hypothetical protein
MTPSGHGHIAGWILLALVGIAVAVALSVTASSLSTQPIGLSGEQLRAGDRLAPAERTVVTPAKPKHKQKRKPAPSRKRNTATATATTTATTPIPAQTPVTPVPKATAVTPAPTHTTTSDDRRREPGDDHGGTRIGSDD